MLSSNAFRLVDAHDMHFLTFATLFPLISAKVLVSYNASHSDSVSVLDQQNLEGWQGADWPKGQAQNASAYFSAGFDPSGVHAAHIHRDANFVRSEYHALSGDTVKDTTYYIGYRVMWQNVDYQTIVWQWYIPSSVMLMTLSDSVATGKSI